MRCWLIFFTFFICNLTFSQNTCKVVKKKIKKVEKYILKDKSDKAFDLLEKIESKCNESFFFSALGDLYFSFKKYEKSQFFYSKSYELTDLKYINSRSLNQFLIVLYKTGKYERFNSLVINKNITLNKTNSLEIASLIEKNTFAFNSQKDSILFNPKSLSINSNSDQYFPSMPINSNVIIFTQRDRVDDFVDENFFLSRKVNNVWTNPIKLGDNINSDYREGSLSVSFDGRDLFFTSCNRPDTYGGCDLYFSTLINDTVWSESINMGTSLNTKYWESQPSISADGQLLFFSSNRYGGYGGSDIWMSRKKDSFWTEPVNLGAKINTKQDEYCPYLHYDNKTFYFASQGHPGFGGFDLYMTDIDSIGEVGDIINLGYPINTHYDESGLIVSQDGKKAYYNSNKKGNLDIYTFDLPQKYIAQAISIVNGLVTDSISGAGVSCEIFITEKDDQWEYSFSSDNSGNFSFSIPPLSKFKITILSKNHDFFSSDFQLAENELIKNVNLVLNRLNLGNTINLNNIYYQFDDYSLTSESLTEIRKIADYLILNYKLQVEIGGHTDNIGTKVYNDRLSEKRAKSVYDMLLLFGIDSNRLSYKGYGFDVPINLQDTELGRLENRRTEIKVTGFDAK